MRDRLEYSEGALYWRDGPRKGKQAGGIDSSTGYRVIRLGGTLHYEHRLIWEIVHRETPSIIDHINGNKTDNRVENLRNCCQHINGLNENNKLRIDNTSGSRGVSWDKSKQKWEAYITNHGSKKSLGRYATKEEAEYARRTQCT